MAELDQFDTVDCTDFLKEFDDDDNQIDHFILVMFDCVDKQPTELQNVDAERLTSVISLDLLQLDSIQLQYDGLNAEFIDESCAIFAPVLN